MPDRPRSGDNGPAHPPGAGEVAEFLRRPDVARLLRAAAKDAVTGTRLSKCLEGSDITRDEARTLLASLLEPLSVLGTRVADFQYWFYPTAEIRRCLHVIDTTCTADSELSRALHEQPAAVVRLNIVSAITSSRLDGIEIDFQSAKDLLLLTRTPRNDPERIVANSFVVHREIADYARREPSVDMYVEIFERLTEGVSVRPDWLDAPRSADLDAGPFSFYTARQVLEKACSISAESADATGSHDAIIALRLHNVVTVPMPFPILNGTMGRLAMHIHAVRAGFPVLGIAPYSDVFADYQAGKIGGAETGRGYVAPRSPLGVPQFADITPWTTVQLQLVLHALARARAEVQLSRDEEESLRHLLEPDPSLNRRQRSVLGRALAAPDTVFRIAYHKTTHAIAYSTARADFAELEAKGLLRSERQGHSFVYRAVPDLAERIGRPRPERA